MNVIVIVGIIFFAAFPLMWGMFGLIEYIAKKRGKEVQYVYKSRKLNKTINVDKVGRIENMIVIENNYDKPRKVVCPYCKSILGIIPSDIKYNTDGDEYCKCPLCNHSFEMKRTTLFSKEFAQNMEE